MRRIIVGLTLVGSLLAAASAEAKGLVKVQQADGSIQNYPDSTLYVVGKTLRITTADKKGTLVVTDAACTLADKLLKCLPYSVVLKQNGTYRIAITGGSIYFNPTHETLRLKYSSMQVQPNGVLGVMRSQHGTYVTISGKLDGGAQR